MNDFYLNQIEQKKNERNEVYEQLLIRKYGRVISWEEVKELNYDNLLNLMCDLDKDIKIANSPFDLKKLTEAIQESRSGMGGCAMTLFICAFCGTEEMWSNTATPKICKSCAEKMAMNIIQSNRTFMKEIL